MHQLHPLIRAVACATAALAAAPPAAAGQTDFDKLAARYLASHPVAGKSVGEIGVQDLIDEHYSLAEVGALDVYVPREFLGAKSIVDDFKDSLVAVLQVHDAWLDWVGATGAKADQARADIAELRKFLKSARITAAGEREQDFFKAFNGSGPILPAVARLRDGFRSGSTLDLAPRGSTIQKILLAPTRQNFVELAGVFGKLEEASRSLYWNDGLVAWTEFGWNQTQVVATEYPPPRLKYDDFSEGQPMDNRETTGLVQHVAQRAGVTLCWHTFGTTLDPAFELAMAQAIVVDLYGQNNTRSGGSGRSNTTDGITAFIPGGNSNGGALPPTNADSDWRNTLGADHFLKPLRDSQKGGAKYAKAKEDKLYYFVLKSDDTAKRFPVRAPFFGTAAQGKELPPPEFLTDYLEFFRAYKTCFVHWLREFGASNAAAAHKIFADLLRRASEVGGAASFEEVVHEIYEVPFSGRDLAEDSLEGRFLQWLPKGK